MAALAGPEVPMEEGEQEGDGKDLEDGGDEEREGMLEGSAQMVGMVGDRDVLMIDGVGQNGEEAWECGAEGEGDGRRGYGLAEEGEESDGEREGRVAPLRLFTSLEEGKGEEGVKPGSKPVGDGRKGGDAVKEEAQPVEKEGDNGSKIFAHEGKEESDSKAGDSGREVNRGETGGELSQEGVQEAIDERAGEQDKGREREYPIEADGLRGGGQEKRKKADEEEEGGEGVEAGREAVVDKDRGEKLLGGPNVSGVGMGEVTSVKEEKEIVERSGLVTDKGEVVLQAGSGAEVKEDKMADEKETGAAADNAVKGRGGDVEEAGVGAGEEKVKGDSNKLEREDKEEGQEEREEKGKEKKDDSESAEEEKEKGEAVKEKEETEDKGVERPSEPSVGPESAAADDVPKGQQLNASAAMVGEGTGTQATNDEARSSMEESGHEACKGAEEAALTVAAEVADTADRREKADTADAEPITCREAQEGVEAVEETVQGRDEGGKEGEGTSKMNGSSVVDSEPEAIHLVVYGRKPKVKEEKTRGTEEGGEGPVKEEVSEEEGERGVSALDVIQEGRRGIDGGKGRKNDTRGGDWDVEEVKREGGEGVDEEPSDRRMTRSRRASFGRKEGEASPSRAVSAGNAKKKGGETRRGDRVVKGSKVEEGDHKEDEREGEGIEEAERRTTRSGSRRESLSSPSTPVKREAEGEEGAGREDGEGRSALRRSSRRNSTSSPPPPLTIKTRSGGKKPPPPAPVTAKPEAKKKGKGGGGGGGEAGSGRKRERKRGREAKKEPPKPRVFQPPPLPGQFETVAVTLQEFNDLAVRDRTDELADC